MKQSRSSCRVSVGAAALAAALLFPTAHASPPAFTGTAVHAQVAPAGPYTVNLRFQGAITGTPMMSVTVVNIVPAGVGISATVYPATGGVCLQLLDGQGIDYTTANAAVTVNVINSEAPNGVQGTIPILTGAVADNTTAAACADPHNPPVANAGADRTVPATAANGALVQLDGSASTDPNPGGAILSYVWADAGTGAQLATGVAPQVQLAAGAHRIRLTVTDNSTDAKTNSATAFVTITVAPYVGPVANAGPANRAVPDTDGLPGEWVDLDGSASTTPSGTIASYSWSEGQTLLGTGAHLRVRLPDGANTITLTVTDSSQRSASTSIVITVGNASRRATLGALPGLTPNQRSTAGALDSLCGQLAQANAQNPAALTGNRADLLAQCNGIILDPSQQNQVGAVSALGAQDFSAMRTQALVFSNSQYLGILDRMAALRGGAHGLSLSDLNIGVGGQAVSLGTLSDVARHALGGGASADATEPGGLLSDRVGIWLRGNYASGDQGVTQADAGFRGHQTTVTLGVDDRLTRNFVIGAALGRARGDVAFGSSAGGGIITGTWIGTVYASSYLASNFYLDAVVNFAKSNYDTTRHIVFQAGGITVDRTASGATGGTTWSGGLNLGYDFTFGGLTLTPLAGYFYEKARIDSFGESGAAGLNLDFDKQTYRSATANLGVQTSFAVTLPFGVLLPHARAEWLHEFENNAALLNVHFDADPNAGSGTPPMLVQGDVPNRSYWRLSGGTSLQFKHGVSAYVEYQRLTSYGALAYHDIAVGLRAQQLF